MSANGALLLILFMAAFSAGPLIAATFVGRRMGYRGIALIVPWIVAVGLAMLLGGAIYGVAKLDRTNDLPMTTAWTAAMLIAGYLVTLVYLIVLAARRLPSRPADAANVF